MSETKRVEVVFPIYNRREITLQCLRSLARITGDLDVHVVMVDDGSSDGSSEAVEKEFPDVEVIRGDGNFWFTEGTNVGVRAALKHNPDYVLMMNDDQVFDADFLRFMVETAEKNPRSAVGSLLLLWDTPHKLFQVSPEWGTLHGGWKHWIQQTVWTIPDKPWEVGLIVGNCLLVPKAAIDECGLMDAKRHPNRGDAEYTPRLRKNGWTLLIDPRARVFCQPNNLPARVGKMSLKAKMRSLLFDLGDAHNLRRRFYGNIDGAPTKLQGVISYFAFFVRTLLKRNLENIKFAEKQIEPPLKERFASAVVDE